MYERALILPEEAFDYVHLKQPKKVSNIPVNTYLPFLSVFRHASILTAAFALPAFLRDQRYRHKAELGEP